MKTNGNDPSNGLTKREYFAAMALQGYFAKIEGNDYGNYANISWEGEKK